MVVLGLPTECLMLLVLIAGIHLSGGLDPFLNWFSSFVDRWRNGPAIITNRRPLSQVSSKEGHAVLGDAVLGHAVLGHAVLGLPLRDSFMNMSTSYRAGFG